MNDDAQPEWCPEPQNLLGDFERLAAEIGHEEYVRGAMMTREWIALLESNSVTQMDFDDFFDRLENIKRTGSGYFDLWMRVRHWAYQLGLAVPDDHPWRVDMDVICCVENANFESQLSIDKEYRIVTRDDAKAMVRVENDESKLRWYPNTNFRFPVKPVRNLIRMESQP